VVNVHEADYENYNKYFFHFGLLFSRFLQIKQTYLDQFVEHIGERLAFLQRSFWKQRNDASSRNLIFTPRRACACQRKSPRFSRRTA
jgi:hypothetical protein